MYIYPTPSQVWISLWVSIQESNIIIINIYITELGGIDGKHKYERYYDC